MVAARCPSRRAACAWALAPRSPVRRAANSPSSRAVVSFAAMVSAVAWSSSVIRRSARSRSRSTSARWAASLASSRAISACKVSIFIVSRAMVPAWRVPGGRGLCRISARSTLTRALPSGASERGNPSRLASKRAASAEILRRAPSAAYVSISTDIGRAQDEDRGNRVMIGR
jgi:hypothetical protein